MKICFIDHPAHLWSGTTAFFIEYLEQYGSVDQIHPDRVNVETLLVQALESNYDLYVFYQYDFLAYAFVAAHKNVLIAPMIDGSANFGLKHWKLLKGAKFWSWSINLHKFLNLLDLSSFHAQFWPEPQKNNSKAANYFYYWFRGDYTNWNITEFDRMLRENFDDHQIIVRDETGQGSFPTLENVKVVSGLTRSEHLDLLKGACAFIAPRPSEGLGFSFVEALSLGVPVIGFNYPTMNEYVLNNITGYLVGKNKKIPRIDFNSMRRNVKSHVEIKYSDFLKNFENFDMMMNSFENKMTKLSKRELKNNSKVYELLDYSVKIYRNQAFPSEGLNKSLHIFIKITNVIQRFHLIRK